MSTRSQEELMQAGFPTISEMIEMVDTDILSYWDFYDENTFTFMTRFTVSSFVEEDGDHMTVVVIEANEDNADEHTHLVKIPMSYFKAWTELKASTLADVGKQLRVM